MAQGRIFGGAVFGLMSRSFALATVFAGMGALSAPSALAQQAEWTVGTPWTGEKGITETVEEIMRRARLEAPIDPANLKEAGFEGEEHEFERDNLPQAPGAKNVSQWPWNPANFMPIDYSQFAMPASPQTVGLNFVGAVSSESGFVPPDNHGDVGPTQVLVCVNGRIKVFAKSTGVLGGLNASTNTFFNSVRNASGTSDPRVRFDRLTNRWFVLMINVSTPNRILLAVSSGPTILSTSSFTFYQFDHTTDGGGAADAASLFDYPSLGVDANAIYTGGNCFTSGYIGSSVHVIRKSSVLSGGPIVSTAFRQISSGSVNGIYTPMGVNNDDPASGNGYFIGTSTTVFSQLDMRRIATPGGTPSISANIAFTVPATVNPQAVNALGSTATLAAIDDRLYGAMMTKNRVTGARTLWTAHHIEVGTAGIATTSGNRDGVRWYQIQNLDATPSLVQSGTLFDSAITNPRFFWFGSIAQSGQGHAAIGCTSAGLANRADATVSGRLRTDALGTTQPATFVTATAASYNAQTTSPQRWGDYSFVGVDPSDDQTMWAFHQWCNANNSWATQVTKLIAPPPSVPATVSPSSGNQGSTLNVTITGTAAAGSEFYDTEAGFNRMAIALGGTGITVSNIVWNGATPNQVTATLTINAAAAAGARTVTVTNPDGQSRTSGTGIFTVNAGSVCPSYSVQPNPATLCVGGTASFTVAASGTPTPTYQWQKDTVNINDGGNISGATTGTLTINPVGAADIGVYRCVATNTCGPTNSNDAALTVNSSPSISGQPAGGVGYVGLNYLFSVTAADAASYQWRKDTTNIGGAVSPSYSIPLLALTDAGSYDVVVTNSCGSTTSDPAVLEVFCRADFNHDGNVDFFDYLDFVDAYSLGMASADFNGDSNIDFFDYLDFVDQYSIGC